MNGNQPEASTSTSPPPSRHCVSLVIDSELPREQYSRLIEAEGVVHSLVQRLLEKHGGDKHLLFDAQITPNIERHTLSTSSSTSRGQVNNLGFRQSSAFLASLPSLSRYLTLENESQLVWPGFLDTTTTKQNREELPWETSKIKHRRRETCLLNGIVEGVETLSRRPRRDCSRRFIHTITPPEAAALLNQTLHPSASSSSINIESHYLIVLTSSISTDTAGDDWRALPTSNLDHEWDERSWREVGEGCMSKGIYASCIVAGREEDSELSRSLRILCQETSPNGFEEAWFDVPEDADVAISGFGIDPRTVPPSPSAQATSTSATEQIITPATNQTEQLPNLNAAKLQHAQNQMQTFRMIQAKAAESGNPLNAQAMSQLISALKSGNLDHNSAGMQQIKNLFSLQQQQKLGQASMNPAAAAAAVQAQGQGQGGGTDQLLLAAMRQQMLQQNQGQGQGQGQVNMGQIQQQQMQQQQQQQPQQRTQSGSQPQYPQQSQNQPQNQIQNQNQQPNQNQQQNRPNQVRVWSGSLIWNPNSTTRLALNLDANAVGGNPLTDYKPELWSKDLLISTITTCTFADLQNYSRTAKAPFAIFTPQSPASGGDTSNAIRYSNMAKSLHAGGQMALINFGNDRGLIIFTMLSNGESKSERLMALVCVNTPLPSLRGQQNQSGGDSNQNQNPNQNQTQNQIQNQNHQRSQSQQGQQQIQGNGNGNGLGLGIPSNLSQGQSISPSMINQQQQQNQQYAPNQQQQQQPQQYNQQQQFNQQQQQQQQQQPRIPVQQQPSQTQQYMLTPEQNQIFRQLVAQHNLNADVNFDPFNLDEGKYRQIMSLVNQANEQQRLVKQQQQLQQQIGVEGQMGMMQQQQQFGGQNGFQGMNMGGQGQGQGQGFQ